MIRALFNRLRGVEKRTTGMNLYGPDWTAPRNFAPGHVSPSAVLSNLGVAARCVALRSELLSSVPLKLFRRKPDGDRERISDTQLTDLLERDANPWQTAYEVREYLTRCLDLNGNAFALIERDARGEPVALWPIAPSAVIVEKLPSGKPRYRVSNDRGTTNYVAEEILHIRGPSPDGGLLGQSPIQIARANLALAMNLNSTAGTLAESGLRPSGVISHPAKLSAQGLLNLRNVIMLHNAGPGNAGAPLLLEDGMKWESGAFSAEDAELLESRRLSNEDTARIFNVPGGAVGIRDSVSYGSAQADAHALVQNSLAPLAERVEQALMRCLLTAEERRALFIEHDLSGLLRGDASQRWSTYRTAREIGGLTQNEIRAFENLPRVSDGDDPQPLKLQTAPTAEPIATVKP